MAVLDQAQLGGATYDLQDTKAQAMIAPAFSAAQAYSAGDSVTYNGTMYTFTADHAAGAWIGTDATTVPGGVAGEVADLKSAVGELTWFVDDCPFIKELYLLNPKSVYDVSTMYSIDMRSTRLTYGYIYFRNATNNTVTAHIVGWDGTKFLNGLMPVLRGTSSEDIIGYAVVDWEQIVGLYDNNKNNNIIKVVKDNAYNLSFSPTIQKILYSDIINIKVAFVGDSLTQGLTGNETEGSASIYDFVDKPIPEVFKENLEKRGFAVTVKNFGRHGLSPITYWQRAIPTDGRWHSPDEGELGDTIEFDNTFDVVFIMLGTNGHLDTNTIDTDTAISEGQTYEDYANTHCGCYCKIIEYIMEQTGNRTQIILIAPPYANASGYEQKIINSVPTVKALGERYQIPVINATFESGVGKFNKATYYNQTDLVHLNQAGYLRLGNFFASQYVSLMTVYTDMD